MSDDLSELDFDPDELDLTSDLDSQVGDESIRGELRLESLHQSIRSTYGLSVDEIDVNLLESTLVSSQCTADNPFGSRKYRTTMSASSIREYPNDKSLEQMNAEYQQILAMPLALVAGVIVYAEYKAVAGGMLKLYWAAKFGKTLWDEAQDPRPVDINQSSKPNR